MVYNISSFINKDIFIVECCEKRFLVYAPLAGLALWVTKEELESFKETSVGIQSTTSITEVWNQLQMKDSILRSAMPEDIDELTILINQRCNFSCSYCYSAQGRSSVELDTTHLHHVLDFFIRKERGNNLKIVFSGGGDPVLSFSKFRDAVEYAEMLANGQNIALTFGMVTNGSTLTDDHIGFIKEHHVQLVLSFDILKDVHNKQRSHFEIVVTTLFRMINAGLTFGLRCTITPLNVSRQCEMVETLHRHFPQIKSAAFEAVLSRDLYKTEIEQTFFYDQFVIHYFKARKLGEQYGIDVGNTIYNSVECCKIRSCLGKLVVTPNGALTACSRISMPKEAHYELFKFGEIDSEGIAIDHKKYNSLMADNAQYHSECHTCIAKWHCGGGCLLARKTLTDRMPTYCNFMKNMVIETLKYNLR